MYKHPKNTSHTIDMNYMVPGLAFFTAKEIGLAALISRFFDFMLFWAERLARRSTRI